MENKARATVAGVFVVIMLSMLVGVILWFSDDKVVQVEYDIVTTNTVNGLSPQAIVQLRGIDVGRVSSVSFIPNVVGGVRIRMLINRDAPISKATYAVLSFRGVTGTVYVELLDDLQISEGDHKQLLYTDDTSEPPEIPLRTGTLESFAESAQKLLHQANGTLERLNAWLSVENEQVMFAAVADVRHAVNQITHLADTLDDKAGRTLDQASRTLQNVDKMVTGLSAAGGALTSMTEGAKSLGAAVEHLGRVTLPYVDKAARGAEQTLRAGRDALQDLQAQPQSLIFGRGAGRAGPGEPGYESPYAPQEGSQ